MHSSCPCLCDKGSEQPSPAPTPLHHDATVTDLAARRKKDWEHHTCPGNNNVYRRSSGWFVCPPPNGAHTCFETVNKYGQHVLLLWFRKSFLLSLSVDVSPVSHVCRTVAASLNTFAKSLSHGSLTPRRAPELREREGWSWRSRPRMLFLHLVSLVLGVESEEAQP